MENRQDDITIEDLSSTEKIFGLNFTQNDRELILSRIKKNLNSFLELRKFSISNDIPPSFYFKPKRDKKPRGGIVSFSLSKISGIPENFDDLAFFSIIDLANLIKNQKLTSADLTQLFLDRIKKYDDNVKSFITLNPDAKKSAEQMDELLKQGTYLGPLHGIPFGAKDLLAFPKLPTTWGTPPYKEQILNVKSTVIERVINAGGILLGKLSLGELAWGDVWFGGQTKTPWNLEYGSSGSSAGSAAAVAAGFATFTIGSETHGSIVSPSTRCGVTGLRPSFGRVSRHGAMALSWSMDKLGPICHSVEDCAIVFNTIYGPDGIDETVVEEPFAWDPSIGIQGLKIGYLKEEFEKDDIHEPFNSGTLNLLRSKNIDLIPLKLPDLPYKEILFILHCEAAAAFDELTISRKVDEMVRQGEETWPNTFRWARFIPAIEYIKANRIRSLLIKEMHEIFQKVDILIGPSLGDNLTVTNLTGHPCITLPNGFKEEKLPTSISFMAGLFQEENLMLFAKFVQDLTHYHLEKPSFPS